jgi:hypothetical protein
MIVLIAGAVILAGLLGIAAVVAAGESDRLRDASRPAEDAIWAVGFSLQELHLLSVMASVARTDLDAAAVEVVLREAGDSPDGLVVTGSRLPAERIGMRVAYGAGIAGRVLATRGTTVQDRAVAAPITGKDDVHGAVVATRGGRDLGPAEIAQLEGLAAEAGRRLDRVMRHRHERPPGHRLVG